MLCHLKSNCDLAAQIDAISHIANMQIHVVYLCVCLCMCVCVFLVFFFCVCIFFFFVCLFLCVCVCACVRACTNADTHGLKVRGNVCAMPG